MSADDGKPGMNSRRQKDRQTGPVIIASIVFSDRSRCNYRWPLVIEVPLFLHGSIALLYYEGARFQPPGT